MELARFCGDCGTAFAMVDARFCGGCGAPRVRLDEMVVGVPGSGDAAAPVGSGDPSPVAAPGAADHGGVGPSLPNEGEVDERTRQVIRPSRGAGVATAGPVVILGDGREVPDVPRVLLGRDPSGSADEALIATDGSDLSVSKTHVAVERDASGLWLVDLHSTNGVEMERPGTSPRVLEAGERVLLRGGDQVRFGEQLLTVVVRSPGGLQGESVGTGPGLADDEPPVGMAGVEVLPPAIPSRGEPAVHGHAPAGEDSVADPVRTVGVPVEVPDETPAEAPRLEGPALQRHTWAAIAAAALGAANLAVLFARAADWGIGLGDLLGWSEFLVLIAMSALIVYCVTPNLRGRGAAPYAASVAALVVVGQSLALLDFGLVPGWLVGLTAAAGLACAALLLLPLLGTEERGMPASDVAAGFLLPLMGVAGAGSLSALFNSYRDPLRILVLLGLTALVWWAWSAMRSGRAGWVVPSVVGLTAAAALGNWTDALPSATRTLVLATGGAIMLSPGLRAGTPWAGLGREGPERSPALGTSPGTGVIAIAWADLNAWVRSAWPAMVGAGGLFWLTFLVLMGLVLAPLLLMLAWSPLLLIGRGGSDEFMTGPGVAAVLGAIAVTQVIASVLGQAMGLLSSQALAGAAAEYDGEGRVRGGGLARRALGGFAHQWRTVVLYTGGVFLGSLLCLAPGIYLQIRWAFALPSGMDAKVRGSDALGASWRLTEGRAWPTVGVHLVGGLVTVASGIAGAILAVGVQFVFGAGMVAVAVAVLAVAFGVTCNAVLVGSAFRQFLSAHEAGPALPSARA